MLVPRIAARVFDVKRLVIVVMVVSVLPVQIGMIELLCPVGHGLRTDPSERLAHKDKQQNKGEQTTRHSGEL